MSIPGISFPRYEKAEEGGNIAVYGKRPMRSWEVSSFAGVVGAAADSHNGVAGAFFDLFDGALNLVANGDLRVVLLCV